MKMQCTELVSDVAGKMECDSTMGWYYYSKPLSLWSLRSRIRLGVDSARALSLSLSDKSANT